MAFSTNVSGLGETYYIFEPHEDEVRVRDGDMMRWRTATIWSSAEISIGKTVRYRRENVKIVNTNGSHARRVNYPFTTAVVNPY